MNIFHKISDHYGNQDKARIALDVSTSTFSSWILGQKIPRRESVIHIRETYGFSDTEMMDSLYPREEIRPDIFGK